MRVLGGDHEGLPWLFRQFHGEGHGGLAEGLCVGRPTSYAPPVVDAVHGDVARALADQCHTRCLLRLEGNRTHCEVERSRARGAALSNHNSGLRFSRAEVPGSAGVSRPRQSYSATGCLGI